MTESIGSPELPPSPKKPRRRWLRFSLRSLLLLTLLLGIAARWMAVKAERQKTAVAVILADGGSVIYDYQYRRGTIDTRLEPPGPAWLRRLIGDDYFTNVRWVRLSSDGDLANIDALTDLQSLQVVPVSGGRPKITDAGLKNIAGLSHLTSVYLTDCAITDEGLSRLAGLNRLESLNLGYTLITDKGLKHLARLNQLRYLDLRGTQFAGVGLSYLSGLSHLESLDLSRSMVSDEGLKCLARLKSLKYLDISAAIQYNDEAAAELQKALPGCLIKR